MLLFFFLILEGVFRIAAPQDLMGPIRTISEKGYMLNRPNWTARHKQLGYDVTYRFNSLHLRGEEVDQSKFNVLCLGDSYTFGPMLEEEETFVGRLGGYAQESFPEKNIQFLNGGGGGWGTADYVDFLEDKGEEIAPEMVVVFFNSDDIGRSLNRFKYHNPDSKLFKLKRYTENIPLYAWMLEHSHFFSWFRSRLINIAMGQGKAKGSAPQASGELPVPSSEIVEKPILEESQTLGQDLFIRMVKWCKQRDIPLVVLTTGWHFKFHKDPLLNEPTIAFMNIAEGFFMQNEVPFHDLTLGVLNVMGDDYEEYVIIGDYHPNAKGAKLIADLAWVELKAKL